MVFIQTTLFAQNVVPNYSFEQYDSCFSIPSTQNLFLNSVDYYCSDWFTISDTVYAQYFNPCNSSYLSVPNNYIGNSFAQEGDSYTGFTFFKGDDINGNRMYYRGYISVQLISPLIPDSAYCFSMYYKNSGGNNNEYWIDNIGILFTSDTLSQSIARTSQADIRSEKGVGLSNLEWTQISGYYIANGSEQFLNIGTVQCQINKMQMDEQKEELDRAFENWRGAMEQIDDVCVIGVRI